VHNKRIKFHKVVQRHYSGEVRNVYMIWQQIYSGKPSTKFHQNRPSFAAAGPRL